MTVDEEHGRALSYCDAASKPLVLWLNGGTVSRGCLLQHARSFDLVANFAIISRVSSCTRHAHARTQGQGARRRRWDSAPRWSSARSVSTPTARRWAGTGDAWNNRESSGPNIRTGASVGFPPDISRPSWSSAPIFFYVCAFYASIRVHRDGPSATHDAVSSFLFPLLLMLLFLFSFFLIL